MKNIKTRFGLALVVIGLFIGSGCSTMQGLGKDVQKAGQAIERAADR